MAHSGRKKLLELRRFVMVAKKSFLVGAFGLVGLLFAGLPTGCSKEKGGDGKKGGQEAKKTKGGATLYKSSIAKKGEEKTYTVKPKKGQLIEIALTNAPATSSPVDYTIELLDPKGERVIRLMDGNGSDGTTKLETKAYASVEGEHKILVYDWDKNEVDPKGGFELTVKVTDDPDKNEPNNGPNMDSNKSLATPVESGKPVRGYIEYQKDADWFKVDAKKNTLLEVELTNAPATSSPVDYTVEMWPEQAKRRAWRMMDGNGSDGTTVLKTRRYVPADGKYYLGVYDWDGNEYEGEQGYKLVVNTIPEPDKNEPNNAGNIDASRSVATPIESGKPIEGMVEYQKDEDWYKLSAEKGKLVKVELTNAPATSSPVDYTLEMWNSRDKRRMWRVSDTNGSDGTTILKTVAYVPAKGDYFLRVVDWDGNDYEESGTYKLTAAVMDSVDQNEPNEGGNFDSSKAVAKPLPKGKSVTGYLEYRDDSDWFVIDHKGGKLSVSLTNAPATTAAVDLSMALHDESGKRVERVQDTNGSDGTTVLELSKELDAGKYYLRVFDWDGDDFGPDQAYSLAYGTKAKPVKMSAKAKTAKTEGETEKTEGETGKKQPKAEKDAKGKKAE
jgi:hypothetical protein